MSLTVNLHYTGKNGNAKKFAREMRVERFVSADQTSRDDKFIRK